MSFHLFSENIRQKPNSILKLASATTICLTAFSVDAYAEDWMVRRQGASQICHVQKKTASPLGQDFKGPFGSRKDACTSAAENYDDSKSKADKCWEFGGGTIDGCATEGVKLPPT